MKRLVISSFCFMSFFFIPNCHPMDIWDIVNARSYSMGNVQSALPGFGNPASYGFSASFPRLSLQYINRYGIKELSTWAVGIDYPNKFLNTGLIISRYGMKAFHETFVGLNAYKKLSGRICLGVRINYSNIHYSDKNPNKSILTTDIGMYLSLLEHFNLSILAINPFFISIKTENTKEKLPSILYVGANYELIDSFILTGEIEKNLVLPVSCKLGFEYNPIKELSVRAGVFTSPLTPSFGVGVHLLSFTVDVAFSKHTTLGFNTCCTLEFKF